MLKKYGNPEVVIAFSIFILTTVLLLTGYIDAGHWTTVVTADVVSFEITNSLKGK